MQPVDTVEKRLVTLDAMRGFAVMGILAMNIVAFAMPEWAYVTPLAYGGDTTADRVAWFLSAVLVDGKMRGLFALLFGASMILIIERAEANGESAVQVHYSRMFWLGLFGLVHYFFLWFGDFLFLYASIGCIAFVFRDWEPMELIKWGLIIFSVGYVWSGLQFSGLQILQTLATNPDASVDIVRQYRTVRNDPQFSMNIAKQLALYRGAYWPIFMDRLESGNELISLVRQSFTETLPLMMLGMACKKNGFLTGEWARARYAQWAKTLVPAGLLISTALTSWIVLTDYDPITALAVALAWSAIPQLILTIGYAALLIMAVERMADSGFIARVAAAGQAAFTNYLGTSIVMTTIFYGYGLGLFGHVTRLELWFFVFGGWAVMLLWSKPWLEHFRYGPLEWLWRSLARMKLQPLAR